MSKYKTIQELSIEDRTAIIEGRKLLVLSEHDIDVLLKEGIFQIKDRQVVYGDKLVFPQVPIELPKGAKLIEIKQVKAPE